MAYVRVYPLQIIKVTTTGDSCILLLDAPQSGRQVPVLIGEAEAQAIILAIEQTQPRRPLTHNLMKTIMDEYMLELRQVTIDRFDEGVFYSTLYLSDGITEKRIDSRTSDAVVLAIMQQCDILMASDVLQETSMLPGALEQNLPIQPDQGQQPTLQQLEEDLRRCEANEEYEKAAEIQRQIEQWKQSDR